MKSYLGNFLDIWWFFLVTLVLRLVGIRLAQESKCSDGGWLEYRDRLEPSVQKGFDRVSAAVVVVDSSVADGYGGADIGSAIVAVESSDADGAYIGSDADGADIGSPAGVVESSGADGYGGADIGRDAVSLDGVVIDGIFNNTIKHKNHYNNHRFQQNNSFLLLKNSHLHEKITKIFKM